jgi:hypothetical protein
MMQWHAELALAVVALQIGKELRRSSSGVIGWPVIDGRRPCIGVLFAELAALSDGRL